MSEGDHQLGDKRKYSTQSDLPMSYAEAVLQDVRSTTRRVYDTLGTLGADHHVTSFSITVQNSSLAPPQYYVDDVSRRFIERILGITPHEFALRFEKFVTDAASGKVSPPAIQTHNDRLVAAKADIRRRVTAGLRKITGIEDLDMRYTNYQTAIVDKYHVKLENWPADGFRYESMNLTTLTKISKALVSGECFWRMLTPEEATDSNARQAAAAAAMVVDDPAHGAPTKKVRKPRSDKGVKRGPRKKPEPITPVQVPVGADAEEQPVASGSGLGASSYTMQNNSEAYSRTRAFESPNNCSRSMSSSPTSSIENSPVFEPSPLPCVEEED